MVEYVDFWVIVVYTKVMKVKSGEEWWK